jgi:5-methyltetrahydrofolate--homocysteine methyltransferase
VHIFGGHSNVSFGLPERKLLNFTFVALAILNGADSAMIDPVMNPPKELNDFMFAANALTGKDEFSVQYLRYVRSQNPATAQAARPSRASKAAA